MYKIILLILTLLMSINAFCASIKEEVVPAELEEALTPLMRAAAEGDVIKISAELVKCGVNFEDLENLSLKAERRINIQDEQGRTALFWAVQENKHLAVELLLKVKSDQLIYDDNRMTPFAAAIDNSNEVIVKILLDNLTYKQREIIELDDLQLKYSPLVRAVKSVKPNPLIIKHLLFNGALECDELIKSENDAIRAVYEKFKRSRLFIDNEDGSLDILGELIKQGIFIDDIIKGRGLAPFHRAVCLGHSSIIDLFIKSGVDINLKDDCGRTPLFYACIFRRFIDYNEVLSGIESLINAGADVNAQDLGGYSILHWWVQIMKNNTLTRINSDQMLQLLIKSKADIDIENRDGDTPLHIACRFCDNNSEMPNVIKLLVDFNADVNKLNRNYFSPLQIVQQLHSGLYATSPMLKSIEILTSAGAI